MVSCRRLGSTRSASSENSSPFADRKNMQLMTSRTPSVKTFFDNTDVYLRKSFGVSVRSFVVRSLLGELEGSAILDLGCGDGSISLQYLSPTNRITLVDLSGKMLERAK